jgi:hypothetical protein
MMYLMQGVALTQTANLPGAARLELVDGVIHLDLKSALFDAMLVPATASSTRRATGCDDAKRYETNGSPGFRADGVLVG